MLVIGVFGRQVRFKPINKVDAGTTGGGTIVRTFSRNLGTIEGQAGEYSELGERFVTGVYLGLCDIFFSRIDRTNRRFEWCILYTPFPSQFPFDPNGWQRAIVAKSPPFRGINYRNRFLIKSCFAFQIRNPFCFFKKDEKLENTWKRRNSQKFVIPRFIIRFFFILQRKSCTRRLKRREIKRNFYYVTRSSRGNRGERMHPTVCPNSITCSNLPLLSIHLPCISMENVHGNYRMREPSEKSLRIYL